MTKQPTELRVEESLNRSLKGAAPTLQQARLKALELFARRGFGQTGMREIAAHLGLSPGSLYNHIESKQTLLFDLIEELYECLLQGLSHPKRCRQNASDRLDKLLLVHIKLHSSMALFFLVAEREAHCLDEDQAAIIGELRANYESRIASLLAEIAGTAITSQLRAIASACISLLNSLPAWLSPAGHNRARAAELMVDIVRGSINGGLQSLHGAALSTSGWHPHPGHPAITHKNNSDTRAAQTPPLHRVFGSL